MHDDDTRPLATQDLRVGMVVQRYGARFLLTECCYDEKAAAQGAAAMAPYDPVKAEHTQHLRAFRTEYLGDVPGQKTAIPAGWLATWTVQGNDLAFWAVEVAA